MIRAPRSSGSFIDGLRNWGRQVAVLSYKNYLLSIRNLRSTLIVIFAPFVLVFLMWLIQEALRNQDRFGDKTNVVRNPRNWTINQIPLCKVKPSVKTCRTILYAPNNDPEVQLIIDNIRTKNIPPIPGEGLPFGVLGFPSAKEVDDYLFTNPAAVQGAYIFEFNTSADPPVYNFILQMNETDEHVHAERKNHYQLLSAPMMYAASREIFRLQTGNPDFQLNVTYRGFPHPEVVIIVVVGPLIVFALMMFNFVVAVNQITTEKEERLRDAMRQMGLLDSAYWVSWFITNLFFYLISIFGLIIMGCIVQFYFFLHNQFATYFILLLLFCMTMIPLAILITAFVQKAASGTSVGFVVFLVGVAFEIVGTILYDSDGTSMGVLYMISLFSPAAFAKGLNDLSLLTQRKDSPGLKWKDIDNYATRFTLAKVYRMLILDCIIYWLLALYFDNVRPNAYGARRPFYYFVLPSYWTGKSSGKPVDMHQQMKPGQDPNVAQMEQNIINGTYQAQSSLVTKGLSRSFVKDAGCCSCCTKKRFKAVKDLYLLVEKDKLFCLLGPNGAGKSTTIGMLTGLLPPSSGDAEVFGNSILRGMDAVRADMGVCPQFDVLWAELTGREHLIIFGLLKRLSISEARQQADVLLADMYLQEAAHRRSSSYSGGMRRRLSLAVAYVGAPDMIFLDEPTTGMDPISRRHVWEFIQKEKKGRAIILTTHSMEEADILAEQIGIMANGRLRCVGTPLNLKHRFGSGYRVVVQLAQSSRLPELQDFFARRLSGSLFISEMSSFCTFTAPNSSAAELSSFFELLESQRDALGILDIQISQGTLEEVFIRVAKMSEGKGLLSKQRKEEDPEELDLSFTERSDDDKKKGKKGKGKQ